MTITEPLRGTQGISPSATPDGLDIPSETSDKPLKPTEVRQRLRKAGYDPIPTRGKNPGLTKAWQWQRLFNATDEQIGLWAASFPDAKNTGVLCRDTPFLDLDILHTEAAKAAEETARNWIEEKDGTTLVRFGLPPKRAIPFKAGTPFKKISVTLQAPDGSQHKIEFLADGQQVVVHGIHPDASKPYRWHGCDQLSDFRRDDLPAITSEEAQQLVDTIVAKLTGDHGFTVKARPSKASKKVKRLEGNQQTCELDTFWGRVNQAALQQLGKWVPKLFKDAVYHENTGAYRVTSKTLKRDLEEDISIAPNGIVDWGVWDQGDENEGRRTAIDLVVEWSVFTGLSAGVQLSLKGAAFWLCQCLGVEPASLGWKDAPSAKGGDEYKIEDFYAYLPAHQYLFIPTRQLWPSSSVNAKVPPEKFEIADEKTGEIKTVYDLATAILDRTRAVAQMTWAPGEPELIKDRILAEGGWVDHPGVSCFNLYRPPTVDPAGDPAKAAPWVEHAHRVYDDHATRLIQWFAQRVQFPHIKINHALALGGPPGIGKDTLLEPLKYAVGPWNFQEANPSQLLGRFNSFLKAVVLRISESRDLGDVDRYAFHDHLKVIEAAPPDTLRVDEKHLREYYIPNVVGVIITTNHRTDCLYLPEDDRRHLVLWSEKTKDDFDEDYWNKLWGFYSSGGIGHVCAYLRALDISGFDPKRPPPKTEAFWSIVNAGRSSEESELSDILDRLGGWEPYADKEGGEVNHPVAVTLTQIISVAAKLKTNGLVEWLEDRKNRRLIPHRLEKAGPGYLPIRNPAAASGLWKINGRRQAVYGRKDKTERERLDAARDLVRRASPPIADDTDPAPDRETDPAGFKAWIKRRIESGQAPDPRVDPEGFENWEGLQ